MKFETNDGPVPELPKDELDALLRAWHEESHERARASRDAVLARVERAPVGSPSDARAEGRESTAPIARLRFALSPSLRAAAVVAVAVIAGFAIFMMPSRQAAAADRFVQVPEGGRLDAVAPDGTLIGPCPLEHTGVEAEISGFITRVTVTQRYRNTYPQKVEAVYTFPLSHRAAVDRMRLIVRVGGEERIVEGEVKERELARQIYEAARRDGFVASLLEQERPNIFTQSVANIEPGAEVLVEISYVETLAMRDGSFTFDFPMVVGPRYIPGHVPTGSQGEGGLPAGLVARPGVVLIAPAQVRLPAPDDETERRSQALTAAQVLAALERAIPIQQPDGLWRNRSGGEFDAVRAVFAARYADGSEEPGTLRADGTGEVAGRWFWCPPPPPEQEGSGNERGTGFAQGTDQVPDAALITPMPVRPPERAGHDLSLRVSIDTGGPAVTNLHSDLHRVDVSEKSAGRAVVTLEKGKTIPNRDFVLSWKLAGGEMAEGVLTQVVPGREGYFLAYLVPPARVESNSVRPRELVFVLDVSGSMNGFPIEKSKEVMTRMLGAMRPSDAFNIITFASGNRVLWPEPRPATEENVKLARDFVTTRGAGGGTEMMAAIEAALRPTARVIEPHDRRAGESEARALSPMRIAVFMTDGYVGNDMALIDAVRRHAGTTRVFTFGIGNSVNRYLLAEMARAGRGAADFVLLPSDADGVVTLFTERVQTPVLTDISMNFEGVETAYVSPSLDALPDLYDREPLVIVGRYPKPGHGALRIRGTTGAGPWERRIDVDFPAHEGNSTVAAPIWARAQVDDALRPHLTALQQGQVPTQVRDLVVRLAEQHRIMSPFTSFVAVEKTRVTLGGRPVLVAVPIELPQGVSWEGNFGSAGEVLRSIRRGRRSVAESGEVGLPINVPLKHANAVEVAEILNDRLESSGSVATITAPETGLTGLDLGVAAAPASPPASATASSAPPPSSRPAEPAGAVAFPWQRSRGAGDQTATGTPAATPEAQARSRFVANQPTPGGVAGYKPDLVGRVLRGGEAKKAEIKPEQVFSFTAQDPFSAPAAKEATADRAAPGRRQSAVSAGSEVRSVGGAAPTDSRGFGGGGVSGGGGGLERDGGRQSGESPEPARREAADELVGGLLQVPSADQGLKQVDDASRVARVSLISDFVSKEIAVDFNALPFEQAVAQLNTASGSTIHVDWKGLAEIQVVPSDPVTLKLGKSTSADALRLVLEQLGSESNRPRGGVLDDSIVVTSDKVLADRERLEKWRSEVLSKRAAATTASTGAAVSTAPEQGPVVASAKPRGFTAAELNLLSARLDEGLFIIGLAALTAKDEAVAATKAADAKVVVDAADPAAAPATASSSATAPAAAPPGAEREPLRVIARFEEVDGDLEQALVRMGIEVEARAPGVGVLILRVPRQKLIDLALLDGVRRIEPLPMEVVAAP